MTLVTTFSANDRTYAQDKLAQLLGRAPAGKFPPADGSVTVLPQPAERDAGVLGFTAHAVVFADVDPGWIAAQLPPDDAKAALELH